MSQDHPRIQPKGVLLLLGSRLRRCDSEANLVGLSGPRTSVFEVTLSDEAAKLSKHTTVVLRGDIDSVEVNIHI